MKIGLELHGSPGSCSTAAGDRTTNIGFITHTREGIARAGGGLLHVPPPATAAPSLSFKHTGGSGGSSHGASARRSPLSPPSPRDAQPALVIGRQGLTTIHKCTRTGCVTQCRCIVPAHYHVQLHGVDQSQEPVAHPLPCSFPAAHFRASPSRPSSDTPPLFVARAARPPHSTSASTM